MASIYHYPWTKVTHLVLGDSYQCCILGSNMHSWDFKDQTRKFKMYIYDRMNIYSNKYISNLSFLCVFGDFCNFFVLFWNGDLYFSVTTKPNTIKDRGFNGRDCRSINFTQVLLLFYPYSQWPTVQTGCQAYISVWGFPLILFSVLFWYE